MEVGFCCEPMGGPKLKNGIVLVRADKVNVMPKMTLLPCLEIILEKVRSFNYCLPLQS